jgi:hypothetical protein
MQINKRAVAAGIGATLALGLVGCSSGSSSVKGNRDDVRHVTKQTHTATRTVAIKGQKCGTKSVKHSSGTGKNKRTWTTNDRVCKSVTTGHRQESYQKVTRPEAYCVEVDNVNGKSTRDDRWYTVTSTVYFKMANKHEGDKVKFSYLHTGCS